MDTLETIWYKGVEKFSWKLAASCTRIAMISETTCIPVPTLDRIERCITKYNLLPKGGRVVLAGSGGKDSTLLALSLRELGYSVLPVAIDMGYRSNWGEHVSDLFANIGFVVQVIRGESAVSAEGLDSELRRRLSRHLEALREESTLDFATTPCTHCYNLKIASLSLAAEEVGASIVAFGHHGTDALASLLKSALMYIDRWERGNTTYNRIKFESLVNHVAELLNHRTKECRLFLQQLFQLVKAGKAGTDEPPTQFAPSTVKSEARIVRPLFLLQESEIRQTIDKLRLPVEGSGCGHGTTNGTETPREMVHHRILDPLQASDQGRLVLSELSEVLASSIDMTGSARVSVRNSRDRLLGESYRNSGELGFKL